MNDFDDQDEDDVRRDIPVLESAAAMGLALAVASREKADAFLDEQTENIRAQRKARLAERQAKLLDLQAEDLADDRSIRHWSIRIRHVSDLMKLAFELSLAFIVVAIAFAIGAALWSAAHDDSLVIEAFSVPPDMAARGLTGQAVAAQLQDKLAALQAATNSARPAGSYTDNWGNDIKVEIPNTGVSIGEFYRYLAGWLGHQTHIRGEVYRDGANIVIAARASGGDGGTKIAGAESNFDRLLQQSAEGIYRATQPYRYAVYLGDAPHFDIQGSRALLDELTRMGSPLERAWAHVGIGSIYEDIDPDRAPAEQKKAAALAPGLALPLQNLANEAAAAGHLEEEMSATRQVLHLYEGGDAGMNVRAARLSLLGTRARIASELGDALTALSIHEDMLEVQDYAHIVDLMRTLIPTDFARLHEPQSARAAFADVHTSNAPSIFFAALSATETYATLRDWKATLEAGRKATAAGEAVARFPIFSKTFAQYNLVEAVWPYMARAMAEVGDTKAADALIAQTPDDSYLCLRARAEIAVVEKNWRGADYWFARAVSAAPSSPFANSEWGQALLVHGEVDRAIAQFGLAHDKGPHFADPLEMWGEALMQKNRSDLALAKFEEAKRYAPRWGRLHLKWGEALNYVGRKDEARNEFAVARGLDLTDAERAALSKDLSRVR